MKYRLMIPVAAIVAACFMSFQGGKEPWVVPASASKVANPVKKTEAGMKDAKKVFSTICQTCHGADGTGNGPAAQALNPKPANFASAAVQKQTDGALFWKITEGRGTMAPYKHSLTADQRWNLVHYIRTLKK
ncbi:MAG: cytochrome c [Saprospiraceae bacterium]|nr:cytochrome c [Saprospiraceae bacterium]